MKHPILSLITLAALLLAPTALAQAKPTTPTAPKGKLVIVATTGLEDIGTLSSSFRHAQAALESGHLESVVWLTYGRAVVALDPTVSAVPESVRKAAHAAHAAGVQFVACGHALAKYGIDPKALRPTARVAPNGVHELARLVAQGYAVIRY